MVSYGVVLGRRLKLYLLINENCSDDKLDNGGVSYKNRWTMQT